jgi:hypothetical protein
MAILRQLVRITLRETVLYAVITDWSKAIFAAMSSMVTAGVPHGETEAGTGAGELPGFLPLPAYPALVHTITIRG